MPLPTPPPITVSAPQPPPPPARPDLAPPARPEAPPPALAPAPASSAPAFPAASQLPTAAQPPAAVPRLLRARELELPGFQGHPLRATLLPGEGHPFIVLMVAGAGATDRNWANPALPGNRTGEDLAKWFQDRGLASLRYDKRYIGSRDRGLDVSLDAQVGDLRALLERLRTLPEARGRRILLAGHGEGALLALLAASGADALLLLGIPGAPMASVIREQVKSQLPPASAQANLAWLDQVLGAIRQGQPLPPASKDVLPRLIALGRSLMAPETLAYVRATLDLDPWGLLARSPVPAALAWGDRDVQSPRPARIPDGCRAAVLDLPGANHYLRREERPRGVLNSATALSGYGATSPLADLTPIADWLERLR